MVNWSFLNLYGEPELYFRPSTVEQILKLLSEYGMKAKVVAGCTQILIDKPTCDVLVDVTRLPLNYIRQDGDGIKIGACCTISDLISS